MPIKSRKRTTAISLIVVVPCLALAAVWGIMATLDAAWFEKSGRAGRGAETHDIPVWVLFDTHRPGVSSNLGISVGDGYRDEMNHISAFVSRDQGQFVLDTNTNSPSASCPIEFFFPENSVLMKRCPAFPDTDGDGNPCTVTPIGVRFTTTRDGVWSHVDLRHLAEGESSETALNIRLVVTNAQDCWDISYRDTLWNESTENWDSYMDFAELVTVTRNADTIDGKRIWTIQTTGGHRAYLRRILDNDKTWEPVGIFEMPLSLTIVEKQIRQAEADESVLIRDFEERR
jgi:hypothetical protein